MLKQPRWLDPVHILAQHLGGALALGASAAAGVAARAGPPPSCARRPVTCRSPVTCRRVLEHARALICALNSSRGRVPPPRRQGCRGGSGLTQPRAVYLARRLRDYGRCCNSCCMGCRRRRWWCRWGQTHCRRHPERSYQRRVEDRRAARAHEQEPRRCRRPQHAALLRAQDSILPRAASRRRGDDGAIAPQGEASQVSF